MTVLTRLVVTSTLDKVDVVYLDRSVAKWWNERRDKDETVTFCGWYWIKGAEEAGPFRTRSSAIKSAYYRFVLRRNEPSVGQSALHGTTVLTKKQKTNKTTHAWRSSL